ncbi:MAG: beta-phosphoglucomutase family hydrolase [Actinomycetota bacterium]|jgi:beta-phosphoglucomutase family hydrolase|nr:beta-phosphoglucomutase family hydrolase [Actinomycetota bacterium]
MVPEVPLDWERYDAILFDLDGVITPTAALHQRAWASIFASYGFTDTDYLAYVDGRPRYDGVATFLDSRGVTLPRGRPVDPPGDQTVCAIGNEKNRIFNEMLDSGALSPYPGSLRLLEHLAELDACVGLVTSSRNARRVLEVTGLDDRFDCVVDGLVAEKADLAGKPAPDTYLYAAAQLGVDAAHSVVVEDAVSGVRAGRAGGFGLVIGVDRGENRAALNESGAHIVVDDLDDTID